MMDREEAIEFMNELKTVILEHPIIDEWWKEVHNRRLSEGLADTDTQQTETHDLHTNTHACVSDTPQTDCDKCIWNVCNYNKVEWDADTPQTKTQNSNKNSNVISVYDGVSEAVRCAMCSNPNKSDRGCDGACLYDEKLYERIMKAIAESVADAPQTESTGSPIGDYRDGVGAWQTDCPWK